MEVLVGPTFGMEAAASAVTTTFVRERQSEEKCIGSSSCFFLKEEEDVGGSPGVSSESSSSIGSSGGSDDEEEDGVFSSRARGSLGSLGSLEDSLPIKRGLSNHYTGKSKSFANLLDVSTVKEVEKAENPFNKRRRILLANKWCRSRKSSFYSWQNPNSMPLLALNEDDEETPSTSSNDDKLEAASVKPELQHSQLKVTHKSQSCFSLTDL
ncbi:Exocyst subunit exo70 family protein G1 [Hibiscus syriacus]|uniref:Exocyst subunit exo70 family protein G1 n=1 Tax=Hibiscus syriacus TaxID=106335 RepID=A0A6A3CZK0_HIBSY|nr:uncharacterized protein LOC120210000 [Hibiscus syriacus]KAE8734720.1 Exocyst subunit exo70 family protein G1 [Hibiscus syriacus]